MVNLKPMTSQEFDLYLKKSVVQYAEQKVLSGNWRKEEAVERAKNQFNELLPNGLNTNDHFLFTIFDVHQPVGILWLAKQSKDSGYVYDIRIEDECQGKGYGKAAMQAMEQIAKETLKVKKIGLHVFGHNQIARELYGKLGYQITNVVMEKNI
ncbi:GNAT family N-acetyltransferase [Bacillus spongiae]|uniref:GNAT family N-acetyltransferase n=1 Tax=Bacillus spongiae TaxID=2683610 RepID=A0ABU8H998_9BACI